AQCRGAEGLRLEVAPVDQAGEQGRGAGAQRQGPRAAAAFGHRAGAAGDGRGRAARSDRVGGEEHRRSSETRGALKKPLHVVIALGLTQTLAWGTTYYLPAILANHVAGELGI